MAASHYFLLAALPHLGELGEAPPVTPARLLEWVRDADGPTGVIETILLSDDLIQRDAQQAGEIDQAEAAVLTDDQLSGEAPLPAYLEPTGEQAHGRVVADAVWAAYFRHATDVAPGGTLLAAWVAWEVALRNALAGARAKALDLEVEPYLVAPELGDAGAEFTALLNELGAAGDPLAALGAVDRARWTWLGDREAWFTFGDDELAVYAMRLMLMQRAQRLAQAQAEQQTEHPAGQPASGRPAAASL